MKSRIEKIQKAMDNWPEAGPDTVAYKIRGTDEVVSWVHHGADNALASIQPGETQADFIARAAEQFNLPPEQLVDNIHHLRPDSRAT